MPIQKWKHHSRTILADTRIFTLSHLVARSPRTGADRDISLIETSDWVNIVALTPELDVVMVSQYRHGTDEVTLEIPGGLIDDGESPLEAGVRELREETGYTGDPAIHLGTVEPNPAFINNRCHTYLVENCVRTHELALDEGEDIEVSTIPLATVGKEVSSGEIGHALVVCGFWWLALKRPDLMRLDQALA